jgi:hypothetical protein
LACVVGLAKLMSPALEQLVLDLQAPKSVVGIVIALLVFDLGVLHRDPNHVIGVRESLWLSALYISLALVFGAWVWWYLGARSGMEYYTGFLIEKSLALDNVFVIALIFSYFAIPPQYQHRVLFWGILGVIVLRAIMIGLGAALIENFAWTMWIFGAFLLVTGVITGQLALDRGHELDWLASGQICALLATSASCLLLFWAWERDEAHPVVDFSIFAHGNFVLGCTLISIFYAGLVISGVIYPIWMQTVLGYNARVSGIVMATTSMIPLLTLPVVGQVFRNLDPRPLITVGGIVGAWALWMHARSTTGVSFEYLAMTRFAIGVAMPLAWIPLMMTIMTGLPPEKISSAAGLFNFWRMLASSIGTAIGVTFWDERTVVHRERLVETVSRAGESEGLQLLQSLQGPAADPQSALAALDAMIIREASTLAQQDLFLVFAAYMIVMAIGSWWLKVGKAAPPPETIAPSQGGMGLGFFIARTLLERTGGKVFVGPGDGGQTPARGQPKGARVAVRWSRSALEVPS